MKYLYLDDSGKIHKNDATKFFVLAGFSIDEGSWHAVVRQINGAKGAFFPNKGKPYDWEMKSIDFLPHNPWNRAVRRRLCFEVIRILKDNNCHIYAISMEKAKALDALDETKFFPLAFQRLVAKFNGEIIEAATTGSIVCDWSTYKMDHHISNCVTGMIIKNNMALLRGGVTYGSSASLAVLQVADLIAGTIRRSLEGQNHLDELTARMRELRYAPPGIMDAFGYPIDSFSKLF
jgi:hypothetical protein